MVLLVVVAVIGCTLILVPAHPTSRLRLARPVAGSALKVRRSKRPVTDSVAALSAFSAEVRAGATPASALGRALEPFPGLCPLTQLALQSQDDVVAALRRDASAKRQREWMALAAVWELAQTRGVSVAAVADQLAEHGRQAVAARRLLNSELAEARATVRVLAFLPVIGIFLGTILGANPLAWLLSTSAGHVVVVVALVFELGGFLWVRAIVQSVERRL